MESLQYWVTFTHLSFNENSLLSEPYDVCHNKPLICRKVCHDGETFVLEVRWHPSMKTIEEIKEH